MPGDQAEAPQKASGGARRTETYTLGDAVRRAYIAMAECFWCPHPDCTETCEPFDSPAELAAHQAHDHEHDRDEQEAPPEFAHPADGIDVSHGTAAILVGIAGDREGPLSLAPAEQPGMPITMEGKQQLRAGGTNGSGGPAAGTAGILELPDDVMVYILQHVDGKTLLVVIPSVGEPGQPGPDGFS